MAFPTTSVLDNFNRADGPLGANWTVMAGAFNVISLECGGTVGNDASYWNVSQFGPDCEGYFRLDTLMDDGSVAAVIAFDPVIENGYGLLIVRDDVGGDLVVLSRSDGGAATDLAIYPQEINAGDSFGIERIGNNLSAYYKPVAGVWVNLGTVVDATYVVAGNLGLIVYDTTSRFDDFGGGDYAPSPPIAPTNLTAVATSNTQINLAWTDNSTDETGFKIERYGGAGSVVFTQIDIVGAGVVAYSDTGRDPGVTYTYRVCAYNGVGDSAYTNEASATTMYTTVGYSIITPDGVTYDLIASGLNVNPGIPDGFDLPPITHRTSQLYRNAGALLKSIDIEPRIVTITVSAIAASHDALHAVRAGLWQALRWNRTLTEPPPPARLRYTANGHTVDLYVHFLSDIVGNVGAAVNLQQVGIRLIAYDPLWYDIMLNEHSLYVQQSLTVSYIIGKLGGLWSALGNVGTGAVTSIVISDDGDVIYVGGVFQDWNGDANADRIVKYTISTGIWTSLSTGMNGDVNDLALAPNGDLYAVGAFTTAGGVAANRVAVWSPTSSAWSALDVGLNGIGLGIAIAQDGAVYVTGNFNTAGGNPANYIAKWSGGAWSALGVGLGNYAQDIAIAKDGRIYVTGAFTTAGGNPASRVAFWDGSAWYAMGSGLFKGTGALGMTVCVGINGLIYVGGDFTQAGGVNASNVAVWNGSAWSALGLGCNDQVRYSHAAQDGRIYFSGLFTSAGGLALADRIAIWNGTVWQPIEVDLPGGATAYVIMTTSAEIFIGFSTTGTAVVVYQNTSINTTGDCETYPVISITGPGTLQHLINATSGEQLIFNLYINPGEVITIDLSPGVKTIESSWPSRPSAMAGLSLPQSDLGIWSLKPDPAAPSGDNIVSLFMTGITPADYNDDQGPVGAAQLDDWEDITGIAYLNTDAQGAMYVNIVDDGAGFFHVDLYSDGAKAVGDLVGHTASYNGAGAQAIVADNTSGLGGTLTVVSATAADANIVVYFATAKIEYYNRYLSADEACQ